MCLFTSCSSLSYIVDQSRGQLSLQWNGVPNEKILKDEKVDQKIKDKIIKIEKAKSFFYNYFNEKSSPIYSKTVLLKTKAVSYLVIASKKNEIKPLTHKFPFVGEFPYLGFFNEDKAKSFEKDLIEQDYDTYVRPVYAYSTLGYFEDRILSSFFYYGELELTELIFHELFHTLFFVKDEVDLNEALAEYFSRELLKVYYKDEPLKLKQYEESYLKEKEISNFIASSAKKLKSLYENKKEDPVKTRMTFLEKDFYPTINSLCPTCLEGGEWNNARFAAFLTYEDKQNEIEELHQKLKIDLLSFYHFLQDKLKDYNKNKKGEFKTFLFQG